MRNINTKILVQNVWEFLSPRIHSSPTITTIIHVAGIWWCFVSTLICQRKHSSTLTSDIPLEALCRGNLNSQTVYQNLFLRQCVYIMRELYIFL